MTEFQGCDISGRPVYLVAGTNGEAALARRNDDGPNTVIILDAASVPKLAAALAAINWTEERVQEAAKKMRDDGCYDMTILDDGYDIDLARLLGVLPEATKP